MLFFRGRHYEREGAGNNMRQAVLHCRGVREAPISRDKKCIRYSTLPEYNLFKVQNLSFHGAFKVNESGLSSNLPKYNQQAKKNCKEESRGG